MGHIVCSVVIAEDTALFGSTGGGEAGCSFFLQPTSPRPITTRAIDNIIFLRFIFVSFLKKTLLSLVLHALLY
jgi:hypothetical protein